MALAMNKFRRLDQIIFWRQKATYNMILVMFHFLHNPMRNFYNLYHKPCNNNKKNAQALIPKDQSRLYEPIYQFHWSSTQILLPHSLRFSIISICNLRSFISFSTHFFHASSLHMHKPSSMILFYFFLNYLQFLNPFLYLRFEYYPSRYAHSSSNINPIPIIQL